MSPDQRASGFSPSWTNDRPFPLFPPAQHGLSKNFFVPFLVFFAIRPVLFFLLSFLPSKPLDLLPSGFTTRYMAIFHFPSLFLCLDFLHRQQVSLALRGPLLRPRQHFAFFLMYLPSSSGIRRTPILILQESIRFALFLVGVRVVFPIISSERHSLRCAACEFSLVLFFLSQISYANWFSLRCVDEAILVLNRRHRSPFGEDFI